MKEKKRSLIEKNEKKIANKMKKKVPLWLSDPDGYLEGRVADTAMSKIKCSYCKHYNKDKDNCPAFPDGVPFAYFVGEELHNKFLPNQKARIFFEKIISH